MIVRVLGAFIAIFTFAVLQETPKKYLGCAGIVGAVGWLAYLLSEHAGADTVLATFISAMTITLISHTFARIFKAPVTVFFDCRYSSDGAGSRHVSDCILHYSGRSCDVQLLSDKIRWNFAGVIAIAIFIRTRCFVFFRKDGNKIL